MYRNIFLFLKMSDKIYFSYERMEPIRYPEPRDIRIQIQRAMISKYKDKKLSEIPLSTELILKFIKSKDETPDKILLKYKVINVFWEEVRKIKNINFEPKMFRFMKGDEPDHGINDGY